MEIPYQVQVSSRRRRVGFSVNAHGALTVHVPCGLSAQAIKSIVEANLSVIEKLLARAAERPAPFLYNFIEGEEFPFYGKVLKLKFSSRLALMTDTELIVPCGEREALRSTIQQLYRRAGVELLKAKCRTFGAPYGLIPRSVGITDAKTRWGSCNSRKHISFCWKVLLLPTELADYIVCHELAHLQELNHSPNFWPLVERLCPNALQKRQQLNELPDLWG